MWRADVVVVLPGIAPRVRDRAEMGIDATEVSL